MPTYNNHNPKPRGLFLLPSLRTGGAEVLAVTLAAALKSTFDVEIIVVEASCDLESPVPVRVLDRPIYDARLSAPQRLRQFWLAVCDLERIKRTEQPAFVLSFMELCNIANAITRRDERLVLSVHSDATHSLARNPIGAVLGHLFRLTFPLADAVVAVSTGVAADLRDNFSIPVSTLSVIQNGIDVDDIARRADAPLPDDLAFLEHERFIVTVGRLADAKNHEFLFHLIKRLRRQRPDLRCVLVGDGPNREQLVASASRLGLAVWQSGAYSGEPVVLCGRRDNPFPIVARSRVFVFPSMWEGFGLVLAEALACGVSICSNDCSSGPRDIFDYEGPVVDEAHRTAIGSLLGIDALDAWAQEVEYWLDAPAEAERQREKAAAFDIAAVSSRWIDLLRRPHE